MRKNHQTSDQSSPSSDILRKWRALSSCRKCCKESLHTEVGKRRTEEYRSHISLAHLFLIEFTLAPSRSSISSIELSCLLIRIYDASQSLASSISISSITPSLVPFCVSEKGQDFAVYSCHKLLGILLPEPIGQLIGQVAIPSSFSISSRRSNVSFASRSILLIKVKIGMCAHDADLEQLSCLCLHTLGSVDDHDCGIRCHQSTVGIL